MKLEKREITLNESDSLKDVFYLEKAILQAYLSRDKHLERKEAENELSVLLTEAEKDEKRVYALWKKSKEEQEAFV